MKFHVTWILKMFELDTVVVVFCVYIVWHILQYIIIYIIYIIIFISMLIYIRLLYKSVPEFCPLPMGIVGSITQHPAQPL